MYFQNGNKYVGKKKNVALQYLIYFQRNIAVIFIDLPVEKFN